MQPPTPSPPQQLLPMPTSSSADAHVDPTTLSNSSFNAASLPRHPASPARPHTPAVAVVPSSLPSSKQVQDITATPTTIPLPILTNRHESAHTQQAIDLGATLGCGPASAVAGPSHPSASAAAAAKPRDKGIACALFAVNGMCPIANCPYAHISAREECALPAAFCTFFRTSRCLRENCKFFHGRVDDFAALRARRHDRGATYSPLRYMPIRDPTRPLPPAAAAVRAADMAPGLQTDQMEEENAKRGAVACVGDLAGASVAVGSGTMQAPRAPEPAQQPAAMPPPLMFMTPPLSSPAGRADSFGGAHYPPHPQRPASQQGLLPPSAFAGPVPAAHTGADYVAPPPQLVSMRPQTVSVPTGGWMYLSPGAAGQPPQLPQQQQQQQQQPHRLAVPPATVTFPGAVVHHHQQTLSTQQQGSTLGSGGAAGGAWPPQAPPAQGMMTVTPPGPLDGYQLVMLPSGQFMLAPRRHAPPTTTNATAGDGRPVHPASPFVVHMFQPGPNGS